MDECILALDVGGTSIKSALIDALGEPTGRQTWQTDYDADGSREEILDALSRTIKRGRDAADQANLRIAGCGAAFPGPFDFKHGQSHMTHKMQSIRGVPLMPVFRNVLGSVPVCFLHDSTAYMLGEAFSGSGRHGHSPALVTLGTGLGFAYMKRGKVQEGVDRRPHYILWSSPFGGGSAEDFVSRAAIRKEYGRAAGMREAPDVREIADLARQGDSAAQAVFSKTGSVLAEILYPILRILACDVLVVGGQIARSADLFLEKLQDGLHVPVYVAQHPDDAALRGAAQYCLKGRETCVEENER